MSIAAAVVVVFTSFLLDALCTATVNGPAPPALPASSPAALLNRDELTMNKLRDQLLLENPRNTILLESWVGDPCTRWKGISCEVSSGTYVVTKLDLSSMHFHGIIPSSISELKNLTELNLQNNDFTGSIPDSFSSLPYLSVLSVACNLHLNLNLPQGLKNHSNLSVKSNGCDTSYPVSPHSSRVYLVPGIAGGSIVISVAFGVFFTCFYRRSRSAIKSEMQAGKSSTLSVPLSAKNFGLPVRSFSLQAIEHATYNYKTMIGEGGFGSVYRGTLPDGQEVAVKVRSTTSTQGTREFNNEVNLLSGIQHENLVPLLGYCCENEQQILVYPFMSNGSLQDRLYGEAAKRKILDWPTRLSVALGAARGLMHLHSIGGRCIIHRDIKSSNILLDHSMTAKVADFGFCKYAPQEGDSTASLEVRGTAGYLDPEYYSTQHLSTKSDVFSFGVVLLEVISGREPLNVKRPQNEWSLVEWAKQFIRESRVEEIVDPNIKTGHNAEAMWRVVEVAAACVESFSVYRPSMEDVVRELEDALIIENNASEYMRSIESGPGSNRFISIGSNRFISMSSSRRLSASAIK